MSLSEESTIDETLCTFAKYFIWSPILIVAGKCEFVPGHFLEQTQSTDDHGLCSVIFQGQE